MESSKYPPHPLAEKLPLMGSDEYRMLRDDIEKNGLRYPIILAKDDAQWKILDGRHRERACLETGVKPRYDYYDGDRPKEYVIRANLRRRHLTPSAAAMLATDLVETEWGGDRKSSGHGAARSVAEAAEICDVGERSVRRANQVKREAEPEVVREVMSGNLTLGEAEEIARLEREQQLEQLSDIRNGKKPRRQHEQDPKVSRAERFSDEEMLGFKALQRSGAGSPSSQVRLGAESLLRIFPGLADL
jgi:ParB-like chromosome segregation protein Spo0J